MGLHLAAELCYPPPRDVNRPGAKKPKKARYPPRAGRFNGFQSAKKREFSSLKPARDGRMTTGQGSVSGPVYTISAAPADYVQDRATRHGWSIIRRERQFDALGGMNRAQAAEVIPIPLLWRGARQGGVVEPCLERRPRNPVVDSSHSRLNGNPVFEALINPGEIYSELA